MKTEIEALLTAIETINAITPETPTIRGHAIAYYLKSLTIDQHNDDEHSMYVIKLENNTHHLLNSTDHDDDSIYYNRDLSLSIQHKLINPNDVLPDYGPWNLIHPITESPDDATPIMYCTMNQDTFTINVTDYHIIITVILSGMY